MTRHPCRREFSSVAVAKKLGLSTNLLDAFGFAQIYAAYAARVIDGC